MIRTAPEAPAATTAPALAPLVGALPTPDLIEIPGWPRPPGGESGLLHLRRGRLGGRVAIRWAVWRPAISRKGTVCLFNGRTEFIEKYYEVIADLLARGFTVATMDWRGQGGSSRLKGVGLSRSGHRTLDRPSHGHVGRFDEYERDLGAFMRHVAYPTCPAPFYALSHSMSGPVMLRAAARRRPFWFDRMVLCAPMLRLNLPHLSPGGLRWLSGGLSSAGLARVPLGRVPARAGGEADFANNCLTSDPVRYAKSQTLIEAAPRLTVGPPTLGWLSAAAKAMDSCFDLAFPRKVNVPILFVGAARDTVVSTPAIEELALRMRSGSYVMIPQARHEIMMERDVLREQFFAAFDAFVPGAD